MKRSDVTRGKRVLVSRNYVGRLEKVIERRRRENESSNDLANNVHSRLFTYATGDEVRGRRFAWWV